MHTSISLATVHGVMRSTGAVLTDGNTGADATMEGAAAGNSPFSKDFNSSDAHSHFWLSCTIASITKVMGVH